MLDIVPVLYLTTVSVGINNRIQKYLNSKHLKPQAARSLFFHFCPKKDRGHPDTCSLISRPKIRLRFPQLCWRCAGLFSKCHFWHFFVVVRFSTTKLRRWLKREMRVGGRPFSLITSDYVILVFSLPQRTLEKCSPKSPLVARRRQSRSL
jgi:hypothetical protein